MGSTGSTTASRGGVVPLGRGWWFTVHARMRMHARGVSRQAVMAALRHGRRCHVNGMCIHAIGRREIRRGSEQGIDLRSYAGVQVVCSHNRRIVTVYRNEDFSRLRAGRRRRSIS